MKILLFTHPENPMADGLEIKIRSEMSRVDLNRVHSTEKLTQCLSRPMNKIAALLIFVSTVSRMKELFTLKRLFENKKLVLILPQEGKALISMGLELSPSFISYQDNDLDDLILVLDRIRQKTLMQPQAPHI